MHIAEVAVFDDIYREWFVRILRTEGPKNLCSGRKLRSVLEVHQMTEVMPPRHEAGRQSSVHLVHCMSERQEHHIRVHARKNPGTSEVPAPSDPRQELQFWQHFLQRRMQQIRLQDSCRLDGSIQGHPRCQFQGRIGHSAPKRVYRMPPQAEAEEEGHEDSANVEGTSTQQKRSVPAGRACNSSHLLSL